MKLKKATPYFVIVFLLLVGFSIGYFTSYAPKKSIPLLPSSIKIEPLSFTKLPAWGEDNLLEMWPAFIQSCQKKNITSISNLVPAEKWQDICQIAENFDANSNANIKTFFETHFVPYKIQDGNNSGLFTGYYVPLVKGSRIKTSQFKAPLYKRPADLVMIEDLGLFKESLKGIRIAGKVEAGNLQPYYSHAEITQGALLGYEGWWLEDNIDAFFIQIQGSAALKLENNEIIRLCYHGTNGHPYTSIGKVLIERKELTKEAITMQTVRHWMKTHGEARAQNLMHQNASFVFFKEIVSQAPLGAQGVGLTAGRSLAVDPVFISFGTPLWLDVTHPVNPNNQLQRLVIAQDKGGAIKGPIRGDLFWGTGDIAGEIAGQMKSTGTYYLLLPK